LIETFVNTHYNFRDKIKNIMLLNSFSIDELERRKAVFMEMWKEMKPIVENEVQTTFDEMEQIV